MINNKTIRPVAEVLTFCLAMSASFIVFAAPGGTPGAPGGTGGSNKGQCNKTLTVTVQNLNFGSMVAGTVATNVVVDPSVPSINTNGLATVNQAGYPVWMVGTFQINNSTASCNTLPVTISITPPTTLSDAAGNSMTLSSFTWYWNGGNTGTPVTDPASVALDSTGSATVTFGATLTVGANQAASVPPASYTGAITATIKH